ncbi:Uncharacterized protein APZ42_003479, partial [Daphnia magna]
QHSLHLSTETDPFRLSVKNGSSKWWGTELFPITMRTAYSDLFPFNIVSVAGVPILFDCLAMLSLFTFIVFVFFF